MEHKKQLNQTIHYYSKHLQKKLQKMLHTKTTLVEAPTGYGKTTAVEDTLDNLLPSNAIVYWFTATEQSPQTSWKWLCREIKHIDSQTGEHLLSLGFPNYASADEAAYMIRNIKCSTNTYLVIDNLHLLQKELPEVILSALLTHGCENLHIICIAQSLVRDSREKIRKSHIHAIHTDDLQLSANDIKQYYELAGLDITQKQANAIHHYTEGWIIAVNLQLLSYDKTNSFKPANATIALMRRLVWNKIGKDEQNLLLNFIPFKSITIKQACHMLHVSTLPEYAKTLLRQNPFIHYNREDRCYYLHQILRTLVKDKFKDLDEAEKKTYLLRAGTWHRQNNQLIEAFTCFQHIQAYDEMLLLPMTNMALISIYDDKSYIDAALDIVEQCPPDIKCRHPLSLLRLAYILYSAGYAEQYKKLLDETYAIIKTIHDKTQSGLMSQWILTAAYQHYPDAKKMDTYFKTANEQRKEKNQTILSLEEPFTFGCHSTFALFHSTPKKALEEAKALEKCMVSYTNLTGGHGNGADVLYRAELAYYQGDMMQAEILAYKASHLAKSKKQYTLQMGVAFLLAYLSLFKSDVIGWQQALDSLEQAAACAGQNTNIIMKMLDISYAILMNEVTQNDRIAAWIKNDDFGILLFPMQWTANYAYLTYLLNIENYTHTIGLAEAALLESGQHNLMYRLHLHMIMATSYLALQNREKALENLSIATNMALADKLYTIFATYAWRLGDLMHDFLKQKYPALVPDINELIKRFTMGQNTLKSTFHAKIPSDLTKREYEIAKLAAQGLRNKEIAEKLFIAETTVRTHLKTVFQKLEIDRRTKLMDYFKS